MKIFIPLFGLLALSVAETAVGNGYSRRSHDHGIQIQRSVSQVLPLNFGLKNERSHKFGANSRNSPTQEYGLPSTRNSSPQEYGAPSTFNSPPQEYGVPSTHDSPPPQEYGPPKTHNSHSQQYGAPSTRDIPSQQYGVPNTHSSPSQQYGVPNTHDGPSQQYGVPNTHDSPSQQYGVPNNHNSPSQQYGVPNNHNSPSQQYGVPNNHNSPSQQYGAPITRNSISQKYGVPNTHDSPPQEYGVPSTKNIPLQEYGVPNTRTGPSKDYGVPSARNSPSLENGVAKTRNSPSKEYGVPNTQTGPSKEYGVPSARNNPSQEYGVPSSQDSPSQEYGVPNTRTGPSKEYGVPSARNSPSQEYGSPNEKNALSQVYGASARSSPSQEYGAPNTRSSPSQDYGVSNAHNVATQYNAPSTKKSLQKDGQSIHQGHGAPAARDTSHYTLPQVRNGPGEKHPSGSRGPSYGVPARTSQFGQSGYRASSDKFGVLESGIGFGKSASLNLESKNNNSKQYSASRSKDISIFSGAPIKSFTRSHTKSTGSQRALRHYGSDSKTADSFQSSKILDGLTQNPGSSYGSPNKITDGAPLKTDAFVSAYNSPSVKGAPTRRSVENINYSDSRARAAPSSLMLSGEFGVPEPSNTISDEGYRYSRNGVEIEPSNYEFSYKVNDLENGGDFGHAESRQENRAEGSYFVVLPDGSKQVVDYEADERGFKPRISVEPASGMRSGYDENGDIY